MNSVTLALIVANVLVSMKGFSDRLFLERYKFQVGPILKGEQFRMLTSGFLHVDQGHLFFNMFTLYFFADPVINKVGAPKFLIIYFASLIFGSLFGLTMHKKEPYYSAVGASGAVMGIVYAAIMLNPNMELSFIFFPFVDFPGWLFGVGYLFYSMYGMKKQLGNIGHSAHIGGAIGGYALTLLLYPQVLSQNKTMIIILSIPILLIFIFRNQLENK